MTRHPPAPDCLAVYALSAIARHGVAADVARRFGPACFPVGPGQEIATAILSGNFSGLRWIENNKRKDHPTRVMVREVCLCTVPGDREDWAVHLVRLCASTYGMPMILRDTYEWALRLAGDSGPMAAPLRLREALDEVLDLWAPRTV